MRKPHKRLSPEMVQVIRIVAVLSSRRLLATRTPKCRAPCSWRPRRRSCCEASIKAQDGCQTNHTAAGLVRTAVVVMECNTPTWVTGCLCVLAVGAQHLESEDRPLHREYCHGLHCYKAINLACHLLTRLLGPPGQGLAPRSLNADGEYRAPPGQRGHCVVGRRSMPGNCVSFLPWYLSAADADTGDGPGMVEHRRARPSRQESPARLPQEGGSERDVAPRAHPEG